MSNDKLVQAVRDWSDALVEAKDAADVAWAADRTARAARDIAEEARAAVWDVARAAQKTEAGGGMSNDKLAQAERDCCDAHEAYSQALHSIGQVTNERVHALMEAVIAAEAAIRAALAEVDAKTEPVAVPREPTEAMLAIGELCLGPKATWYEMHDAATRESNK